MRHIAIIIIALMLTGCGQITPVSLGDDMIKSLAKENYTIPSSANIIISGDSIAHDYGMFFIESLANYLGYANSYLSTGIGGQTAKDLAERIEAQVFKYDPELVIFNIGINGVGSEPVTSNLKYILDECLTRNIKVLINEVNYNYNRSDLDIKVDLINEWLWANYESKVIICITKDIVTQDLLADGLHPNISGYEAMFREHKRLL